MASTNGHAKPLGEVDRSPLEFFLAHHVHFLPAIEAQMSQTTISTLGSLLGPKESLHAVCLGEIWKLTAWRVREYLETMRVPQATLEALFARVLPSMPLTPSTSQWLHIVVALTPPFLCMPFGDVRDLRWNPRRKPYPAGVCRDGAQLETALVNAFVEFDERMRFNWVEYPQEKRQQLETTNAVIENVPIIFEVLQRYRLLPDTLKGRHKDAITTLCAQISEVVKSLSQIDWFAAESLFNRQASALCYGALVRRLRQAFVQYGPPRWSDLSIATALSEILSPLLALQPLQFRDGCTTPVAISRYFRPRT